MIVSIKLAKEFNHEHYANKFNEHVLPYLSVAKRGFICRIPLYKVFNYIREARKVCFNHGLIPNMAENKRNRKRAKGGRKRMFCDEVYRRRFVSERSFAMINLRHIFQQ